MLTEVFFATVSEPDSECLRHCFSLLRGKFFVEIYGVLALSAAGFVVVRIPVTTRQTDATVDFLDECLAHEWFVELFLDVLFCGHGGMLSHVNGHSSIVNGACALKPS